MPRSAGRGGGWRSVAGAGVLPVVQVPGLSTEVVIGPEEGVPRVSSVRSDFLALMFKRKPTTFVASLPSRKVEERNRALAVALDLA